MNNERGEQTILIIDDDENIGWALAAGLEENGRHVIVCRDIESADLVLEERPVTHVLTDIKFSGAYGFEGLQVIDRVRRKLQLVPVIAMSGDATPDLRAEARARGATDLLKKPFAFADLEAHIPHPAADGGRSVMFVPTIDEIISSGLVKTVFQPIVWTENPESAVGFEALTRLESPSPLANPEKLFRYAIATNRVADLELAAARSALHHGRELSKLGFLSINVHPALFAEPDRLCDDLFDAASSADVALQRIVLEITEQGALPELQVVAATAGTLRSHGVRLGFDDVGVAHSHLRAMSAVRPSYLKISQQFGTACENSQANRKIVANIDSLARSFSCEVVLEGVETSATAAFARASGIRFGQGFHYSHPVDAGELVTRYGG